MKSASLLKQLSAGLLLVILLLTAPLAGVMIAGESPLLYLQFPPETFHVEQPAFSWIVFTGILLFIVLTTWPFLKRFSAGEWKPTQLPGSRQLPIWGWISLLGLLIFWILAWTRFSWFEPLQRYTFFPLWFCFIIFLNALAFRLSGRCLMIRRPVFFSLLFPASASFWWYFEFLNRFTNNWHYIGTGDISGLQYFAEATLAFSTVLPAVLSIRFLLLQLPVFRNAFRDFPQMPWLQSKMLWGFIALLSLAGLMGIGWKPEWTFPMLWIAPGLMWVAHQRWKDVLNPLLKDSSNGDLTLVWSPAMAALCCGFFWEMWNFYSEAKWIYNVPWVERFYLFEMPLLGYAGYLPFGVICALISQSLLAKLNRDNTVTEEQI